MAWYSHGCWSPLGTAVVVAWGAFFGERQFFSCPAADYEVSLIILFEKTVAFVLVAVALGTLITMMGSGKEANSDNA